MSERKPYEDATKGEMVEELTRAWAIVDRQAARLVELEGRIYPKPDAAREGLGVERLARLFHETYERLAPMFGYQTRPESAVPWDDVPANNKALMLAVAREVRAALSSEPES